MANPRSSRSPQQKPPTHFGGLDRADQLACLGLLALAALALAWVAAAPTSRGLDGSFPHWLPPLLVLLIAVFRALSSPIGLGGRLLVHFGEIYVLAALESFGSGVLVLALAGAGEALGHGLRSMRRRYLDRPRREIFARDEAFLGAFAAAEAVLQWAAVWWTLQSLGGDLRPIDGRYGLAELWKIIVIATVLTLGSASVRALFDLLRRGRWGAQFSLLREGRAVLVRALLIPIALVIASWIDPMGQTSYREFGWLTAVLLMANWILYRASRQQVELDEQVRRLELLRRGARSVLGCEKLEDLLDAFSRDARALVPSLSMSVHFVQKDGECAQYLNRAGDPERAAKFSKVPISAWVRSTIAHAAPRLCEDTDGDDTPLREEPILAELERRPRSVLGVPLVVGKQTIGVATFWTPRRYAFSPANVSALDALADFVGTKSSSIHLLISVKRAEERYRSLFEGAADGIALLDEEGRVVDGNQTLAQILGLPLEKLRGSAFAELFRRAKRGELEAFLGAARRGSASAEGFVFQRADGERRSLGLNAVAVKLDNAPRLLLHARDRSEAVRLQEELVRSQRMELVGSLASGIAHDINNLLGIILAQEDALRRAIDEPTPPVEAGLRRIYRSAMEGAHMSRRLLEYARGSEPQREPVALEGLLQGTFDLVRGALPSSIDVHLDLEVAGVILHLDQGQMKQVLLNLAVNARDAMPAGGALSIRARVLARGAEGEGGVAEAECVEIAVADTGGGIPLEHLPRIFQPFVSTKPRGQGTGLGLFVCQAVVQAHGGEIKVAHTSPRGTCFVVLLPLPEQEREASDEMPNAQTPAAREVWLFEAQVATGDRLEQRLGAEGRALRRAHSLEELQALAGGPGSTGVLVDLAFGGAQQAREMVESLPNLRFLWIVDSAAEALDLPSGEVLDRAGIERFDVQRLDGIGRNGG
ncbi:MAG: PAS domain S-box protein [Planctomycetes bacterium]|nr:PAS domain S-box protein [Planctomycetota bacterium]